MVGSNYIAVNLPNAKPFSNFLLIKDNSERKLRDGSVNCISEKPSYDVNLVYSASYIWLCIVTNQTNFVQQTVE